MERQVHEYEVIVETIQEREKRDKERLLKQAAERKKAEEGLKAAGRSRGGHPLGILQGTLLKK